MAIEFFQPSVEGTDVVVEHTKKTDVWAFGMVLYVSMTITTPMLLCMLNNSVDLYLL